MVSHSGEAQLPKSTSHAFVTQARPKLIWKPKSWPRADTEILLGKKSLGAETHLDCREEQIEQDVPLDSLLTFSDYESSSSSDALSVIDETTLKCMVAEWLSSDQLVFNRKGLSNDFFPGPCLDGSPNALCSTVQYCSNFVFI
jgi:hypothetical protein